MTFQFPSYLLLILLSVIFARRFSVEAGSLEPRDARWAAQVAKNRKLLTRESRQALRDEFEARNLKLADEEVVLAHRIRGQTTRQRDSNKGEVRQDLRDLAALDSSTSELNVLVLLVQWTNHPDRNTAVPVEHYRQLFNGEGRDPDLYPGGSVKEYFETVSFGEMTINFEVVDWIMTDFTEQFFTADGSQGRSQEIQRAFVPALDYLDDDMFNFRSLDSNFDRIIDLTIFMHSGYEGAAAEDSCDGKKSSERVASHARTGADLSTWVSRAQYSLGAYAVVPAFRGTCDLEIARIGPIIHEMIHPFGLPDMYDSDGGFESGFLGGLDRYDVMANPAGVELDLAWPGHIGAWTRKELGWITPTEIVEDGTYDLRPIESFPDMYIIRAGYADKEYLLLENRQPISGDFDEKFFQPGGILIYHVDDNIWDVFNNGGREGPDPSDGNSPRGGPFQSGWPGNGNHYPVSLLQADGLYELEQGINGGHSADIWYEPSQVLGPGNGEKVANTANYPNTDSYAFGNIKTTGFTIRNFREKVGSVMTFEICGLSGDCDDAPAPVTSPIPSTKAPTNTATDPPISFPTPTPLEELVNGSCDIAANAFRPDDSPKAISNIRNGTLSETCYGEEKKGVWYKVEAGSVAAGETVQVNTCFSETDAMNKISVFKGENCNTLGCVETDKIACKNGWRGHVVYWVAETGEDYYLFVHAVGDDSEDVYVDTLGDGSLLLNVLNFPPLPNDSCGTAASALTDGSVVSGSTEGARPETNIYSSMPCGVESAGVWFKVIGTGSDLRATTCLPGTDHPTQIHVFSGSCESLSCISVEANNYAVCSESTIPTNSATVNWASEEGVEYFILVGSRTGAVGKFELSVTEFEPAANDHFSDAISFTIPGILSVLTGSTENATNDFPYGRFCGAPLDTAGVWYTIEGTGDGLSLSTCGENNYNSAISIFTGSNFDELECLTGIATNDPACDYQGVTTAWKSELNETYHIYVHGSAQNSYGNFELVAKPFKANKYNGFCNDADEIRDPGVLVRSNTITATHSAPTNVCGAETIHPGLWYTYEGTGYPVSLSACPSSSEYEYDVTISIFSGDNCGELECISGTTFTEYFCGVFDDEMSDNSTSVDTDRLLEPMKTGFVGVDSEIGVTYYIFVHGKEAAQNSTDIGIGSFELTYISQAPLPGDSESSESDDGNGNGNDNGNGNEEDSGSSNRPSDLSKGGKKSGFKKKNLWYLLLLLLFIPLCLLRTKLRKTDSSKPSGDPDVEHSSFIDERSRSSEVDNEQAIEE